MAQAYPPLDTRPDAWKHYAYPSPGELDTFNQNQTAHAWRWSASSGRGSGSLFISSLIQKLTKGLPDPATTAQTETYFEFERTLFQTLHDNNREAWKLTPLFKAQEGERGLEFQAKAGVPLDSLEKRWEKLFEYPKDSMLHVGDIHNKDPNVPQALRDEFLRFYGSFCNDTSGHKLVPPLRGQVERLSALYFGSYPGSDTSVNNLGVHMLLRFQLIKEPLNETLLRDALAQLSHRIGLMDAAQSYVESLGIGRPNNLSIYEMDAEDFICKMVRGPGNEKYRNISNYLYKKTLRTLFPLTASRHPFLPFAKGSNYLVIAIYLTDVGMEEWKTRVATLTKTVERELEETMDFVKDIPAVKHIGSPTKQEAGVCGEI
ncbi:hypothetical protein LARI1_G008777 [Lachnellula arida]|uniref:Uncharacterized protein n=1 Tax=Lachnellula arida TaxID=1316785 RepID=A0A8T9BA35_9HELO|nr:hypothetical protein LARI1_G008777 [Lachnellula arida]